jgi:hypothetical protein
MAEAFGEWRAKHASGTRMSDPPPPMTHDQKPIEQLK